jgi:alpha-1,3-rhamnosyl/mannosyltransferase
VLVDAEAVATELRSRYRVPAERLAVVPLAVDDIFAPASEEPVSREDRALLADLGVGPPYLLHAGALLERRRPAMLLEALKAARRVDPRFRLVLAGPDRLRRPDELKRAIRDQRLEGAVVRLGWISDRILCALYREAEATLSLSSYEGFGLPPLESLACGTPALVDSAPGLTDLWPDYPYRVDGSDLEQVAAAVTALVVGGGSPAAGIERARRPSWHSSASAWLAELERARA